MIRGWFFQSLALRSLAGSGTVIDWSIFDDTLARARAAGVRIVATLTDQWGACESTPETPKSPSWYRSD